MNALTLFRYPKPRKDGKVAICLRLRVNGRYSYEWLCYVQERHWNPTSRQVLSYDPHHDQFNKLIAMRHAEVDELMKFYDKDGRAYTGPELLAIDYAEWKRSQVTIVSKAKSALPDGFVLFCRDVMVPRFRNQSNFVRARMYETEARLFTDFLKTLRPRRDDQSMAAIDSDLVAQYFTYLQDGTMRKHPTRKDSTLESHLDKLYAVLRYSHRKGVVASVPFLEVELDVLKSKKVKLDKGVIDRIEQYEWYKQTMKRGMASERLAAHTFLMQYYLYGARVADVLLLRNSNVIVMGDRPQRIEFYQKKGRKKDGKRLVSIPLQGGLFTLVSRYWQADQPDAYLLPWMRWEPDFTRTQEENVLSCEKDIIRVTLTLNKSLRRMTARLELEVDDFTSHSSRHSFAQRAKKKGKSIEFIKDALGHSNYNVTAGYLEDLSNDELNEALADVYD